jgi:hypothetical protein
MNRAPESGIAELRWFLWALVLLGRGSRYLGRAEDSVFGVRGAPAGSYGGCLLGAGTRLAPRTPAFAPAWRGVLSESAGMSACAAAPISAKDSASCGCCGLDAAVAWMQRSGIQDGRRVSGDLPGFRWRFTRATAPPSVWRWRFGVRGAAAGVMLVRSALTYAAAPRTPLVLEPVPWMQRSGIQGGAAGVGRSSRVRLVAARGAPPTETAVHGGL